MRPLCWHGKEDIRCESVPDPKIEHPRDAIIKVTSCAICGSDLHLYDNVMPGMQSGDVMGHETMGEVVEVGSEMRGKLKVGDRIVVPFTITCGECWQCKRGNFSLCETTNRNAAMQEKLFGRRAAGLFGYTHLTGGFPGGQTEYLRVPFADETHIKVPSPARWRGALTLYRTVFWTRGWAHARGLALRHDHGSNFMAEHFQKQARFWVISPSYAFVAEPETNGVIERFFRTMKEQAIHRRVFQTLDEVRDAVRDFAARYNAEWLIEKNGYISPLDARAARLDTTFRQAA
jgi:hypothetical protein